MSEHHLQEQSLLAVPIKDDEIFELLERLAATEEMFKTPVSTIKDVAELTDASPTLIARILAEMRGPDEYEKLHHQLQEHNHRLDSVEQRLSNLSRPSRTYETVDIEVRRAETERLVREWTERPRAVTTVDVKLSAWDDDQQLTPKKKEGLTGTDVICLSVFAFAAIAWALHVNGFL